MTILAALGILLILGSAFNQGKLEGSRGGWAAAWHRARNKFQRHRKTGADR